MCVLNLGFSGLTAAAAVPFVNLFNIMNLLTWTTAQFAGL